MRLFVAINFPGELKQRLWRSAEPLRRPGFPIKWVDPEGMHLTLKFLGEVDEGRAREVLAAVEASAAGARVFRMGMRGFGAFPIPERARVVWAGCVAEPPLELLQDRLERALQGIGFPAEGRVFRPHVTLGRVRSGTRPAALEGLAELLETTPFADATDVASVDIMRSDLGPRGARYTRLHHVQLVP